MLATSRERLGVDGEQVVALSTLAPADGLELFLDRARAADADLELADDDLAVIAEICTHLDQLPLAIELAAARVNAFSLRDLLAGLTDRFALLAKGRRDRLTHHRTLHATVGWSYDLLDDAGKDLFQRLGVFAGSFDLPAAAAVAHGAPWQRSVGSLLASLVDQSMLVVARSPDGVRYQMLETLRQFARERFDERPDGDAVLGLHLDHYVRTAQDAGRIWLSPRQLDADAVFDREWDDLRAALDHACVVGDLDKGAALLRATLPHSHFRMRTEHARWCEALIATGVDSPSMAGPWAAAAWWAMISGDLGRAQRMAAHGVGLAATDADRALGLGVAAFALWSARSRAEAAVPAEELTALLDVLDPWAEVTARRALFSFATGQDFIERADRIAELSERVGSPSLIASARYYQGLALMITEAPNLLDAVPFHEEGIALARLSEGHLSEGQNRLGLAEVKWALRAADTAEVCREGVARMNELRYWLYLWRILDIGAAVLVDRGDAAEAAVLIGYLDAHVAPWRSEPRNTTRRLLAEAGMHPTTASGTITREAIIERALEWLAPRD